MPDSRPEPPLRLMQIGTMFGVGGITRHVLGLRERLIAAGHAVTLAGTGDAWVNAGSGLGLVELPTRWVASDGGSVPRRLWHVARSVQLLRARLRAHPVDLIHAHESAPALVALLARGRRRIPVVLTYHGAEPARIAAFGRIARRCDRVLTPSLAAARELVDVGGVAPDRVRAIHLGIPPPPVLAPEAVRQLRAELLGDGERLVVTVARMVYQKGIDVLIDCVAELKVRRPGLRFALVGDGPLRAEYEALAVRRGVASHLRFVGTSSEVHRYFAAADLSLLTSRWEALGLVLLESFQAGTPAVATDCTGVAELIDPEVGRLAPVGDVGALCDAVVELLSDDARLARMGVAARLKSADARFTPDRMAAEIVAVYRELAPGAR